MIAAHALPNVFVLFRGQTCRIVRNCARLISAKTAKTPYFIGLGWWAVTGSNRRPSRCKREHASKISFIASALRDFAESCPRFPHRSKLCTGWVS